MIPRLQFSLRRLGPLARAPALRMFASHGTSEKSVSSFFQLFPKNFPSGGPPQDSLIVNPKSLRREYRTLQSENHPDISFGSTVLNTGNSEASETSFSTVINRAYSTLRNPYSKIAHFIQLYHPQKIDITQDDVSKKIIANFQKCSPESAMEYKDMLMTVLEAHESLELAASESELDDLGIENDARIEESEQLLDSLIQEQSPIQNWDPVIMEAIRLKYWVNIHNAIKDWEPGKPVHLTH